ncbi:calponin-2-like [Simochromis diagramma]|uniref:calponin-2-like n=1 Tax=Simochromis diagramma TaxID=43689 RepID=UPI001A7EB271|nr:calponin-2-like [Simochromis diagramma]
MSSFNKGPTYGLSAEVKNKIAQKYDPQKEEELRIWIEDITGSSIGPDFQKGLKNGVLLCELINRLQPGSVRKINQSALNWHQLENLTRSPPAANTDTQPTSCKHGHAAHQLQKAGAVPRILQRRQTKAGAVPPSDPQQRRTA